MNMHKRIKLSHWRETINANKNNIQQHSIYTSNVKFQVYMSELTTSPTF